MVSCICGCWNGVDKGAFFPNPSDSFTHILQNFLTGTWRNRPIRPISSPLDRHVVKIDLMLANMKNNTFPRISTIILPKVLTVCYSVHLEILAVICGNLCVPLKCQREKWIDISQLYKNHGCNVGQQTCKIFVFHSKACMINFSTMSIAR